MTLLTYLMDKLQKLTENVFDYLAYKGYGYVYNYTKDSYNNTQLYVSNEFILSIYVVVICMHSDHLLCIPKTFSLKLLKQHLDLN